MTKKSFALLKHCLLTSALLTLSTTTRATNIVWTNTAGGNFSATNNWNPNAVPSASDSALITNSGTYSVNLDVSVSVASIVLGATNGSGIISFSTGGNSLSTSALTVNSNGNFLLTGGIFTLGGLAQGIIHWSQGQIGESPTSGSLGTNCQLILDGPAGFTNVIGQYLTNFGNIQVVSGNFQISYCGGNYGALSNAASGIIDVRDNTTVNLTCGGPGFVNAGLIRKSTGTGSAAILAAFQNNGTMESDSGTIYIAGNVTANGDYCIGAGNIVITNGTFVETGTLTTSNLVIGGGLFDLAGTMRGALLWTNGSFGNSTYSGTVASNSVLTLNGTNGDLSMGQYLTNNGTIRVQNANFYINWCQYYGVLFNMPGGLIDLQGNGSIDGCGGQGFVNAGTVRKSAGTGVSQISQAFNNSGTVDCQTGTLQIVGAAADTGGAYIGAGITMITNTTMVQTGTLTTSNLVLTTGGILELAGSLQGTLTWIDGYLGKSSYTGTIASNGLVVLNSPTGADLHMGQYLTNNGTIRVLSGNFYVDWCAYYGVLYNNPGGLVDLRGDFAIDGCGGQGIVNQGTIRKSAGTATSTISEPLANSGLLDVETGNISVTAAYTLTGGTINLAVGGSTGYSHVSLTGAAVLAGTLGVTLTNNYVPSVGAAFNLVSYGSFTGAFTNLILPSASWHTTYNSNAFIAQVVSGPSFLPAYLSGTNLILTSQDGTPGSNFVVLATTNLIIPVSNWMHVATNIFDGLGQGHYTNGIDPNVPQEFFLFDRK